MTYNNPDKRDSVDRGAFPRVVVKELAEKTLAAIALAPDLPNLTPLAHNTATDKLVPWTDSGANGTGTISFFLWSGNGGEDVATHATNDTLVNVLTKAEIEFADIPIPTGESEANLKTALRVAGLREKGFTIRGLDKVQ